MNLKETIFLVINYIMMGKNGQLERLCQHEYKFLESEITYITSTGTTIVCSRENERYFFRECKRHISTRECLYRAISDYFETFNEKADAEKWKALILLDLKKKNNYHKLLQIDKIYEAHFKSMRDRSYSNYDEVGLPSLNGKGFQTEFINFLKFIRGELHNNKMNNYLKENRLENFNANRQIATRLLAELLGIADVIPTVHVAKLIVPNKYEKIGTMMFEGGKETPLRLSLDERSQIDRIRFIRSITSLDFLDAICYQLDHRMGNYNVIRDENRLITGVTAFDNDAYLTFACIPFLPRKTYAGCSSVVKKDGTINRPFIDLQLVNRINDVSFSDLKSLLKDYLSFWQLKTLWIRIRKLQNAIKMSLSLGKLNVLNGEEWEKGFSEKEMSGEYGYTYFRYYMQVDESAKYMRQIENKE